jgi:serine/threonine-protein kinase
VDIYALGCVAYWLVTGTLVFNAPTAVAMMFQHANQPAEPPSSRTEIPLPPEFEAVILSCLAKRPEDRPASVTELATRLRAAVPEGSWTPDRAERWWTHHRPSSTGEECVGCDLTLMPAMTPDQDSEALSAAAQ